MPFHSKKEHVDQVLLPEFSFGKASSKCDNPNQQTDDTCFKPHQSTPVCVSAAVSGPNVVCCNRSIVMQSLSNRLLPLITCCQSPAAMVYLGQTEAGATHAVSGNQKQLLCFSFCCLRASFQAFRFFFVTKSLEIYLNIWDKHLLLLNPQAETLGQQLTDICDTTLWFNCFQQEHLASVLFFSLVQHLA